MTIANSWKCHNKLLVCEIVTHRLNTFSYKFHGITTSVKFSGIQIHEFLMTVSTCVFYEFLYFHEIQKFMKYACRQSLKNSVVIFIPTTLLYF